MWALVDPNGRVCQITDKRFPVHSALKWVEANAGVGTEWRYDGREFTPPVAPQRGPADLEERVAALESEMEMLKRGRGQ